MNDYIKKNINKIIGIFLILQPFLDLLTGICIHRFKMNITIGIVVRIIFLLFICFIVIFIFKKKKLLIPYLIIGIYFCFYVLGQYLYKNPVQLTEIQNLIKVFYFPILLISLYSIKDYIRISYLTLFTIIFFYLILLFVPILLKVGYQSYEITKSGTLGFFNSANEISGIISILTPILFIVFYESRKVIPIIILSIMYFVVILMMGTKTPILSLGITLGVSTLYLWFYLFKTKKYKYILCSLIVIIIGVIGLTLIIPKTNFYKNIRVHLDFLEIDHVTDVFKDKKLIDHFIFSSRLKFLNKKSMIYHKSNRYQKLFGIGYINNNKNTKLIEMDYFDIYYSHGIVGFIVIFTIIIYVLFRTLHNNRKKSYEQLMKETSLFFIIFLSFFTGHIITAPSVSLLSIILILSLEVRLKKDLLFVNIKEKEQLNLLNNLDYKKYNVTLIIEEKERNLLKNVNKNITIEKIKENNNKNDTLEKLTDSIRILVYKIFNYHNYDFSCCFNIDNYRSNEMSKISSTNNSIYIYDNHKNEKEYKKIFESIKIYEYRYIIFNSKKTYNSFIKKNKELEGRAKVLNSSADMELIING